MGVRAGQSRLDPASFDVIADLAYRESGLTLVPEKATMVESRLRPRLRALSLADFAEYSALVQSENGAVERRELISALTTNVSYFFRETHHFEEMCKHVKTLLPKLQSGGRVRIWSAGCSQGQEPMSAAIALLESVPEAATLDLRILATDIDSKVIRYARAACFTLPLLSGLSATLRKRYFTNQVGDSLEPTYTPQPKLLSLIRFNELNLLRDWPMRHQFDIIFCRNVIIYFDVPTQEELLPRFRKVLRPDGMLFLGHSERINDREGRHFQTRSPTSYQRMAHAR